MAVFRPPKEYTLTERIRWQTGTSADEVLAALPQTIVEVDSQLRLWSVNRPGSPAFSRPVSPGDRLDHVLKGEAGDIGEMIENAQRTGGAIIHYRAGTDLFRVTAKPLTTAPHTLLVFERMPKSGSRAEVGDLSRDWSSFLASVSHGLRTPLAAVVGYVELLSEQGTDLDASARLGMVRELTDQVWDLAGTVEDLLAAGRIEIGDLRVARVPVNVLANVAQVIESMGDRGSSITLKGDRTITGIGDPARLRQVIRNLVGNALVHGAAPVTVEVAVKDGYTEVRVRDRGPGIPQALAESVFDRYMTAAGDQMPARIGIGLWISRELARLMGGDLTYAREGRDTVFQASIPLAGRVVG